MEPRLPPRWVPRSQPVGSAHRLAAKQPHQRHQPLPPRRPLVPRQRPLVLRLEAPHRPCPVSRLEVKRRQPQNRLRLDLLSATNWHLERLLRRLAHRARPQRRPTPSAALHPSRLPVLPPPLAALAPPRLRLALERLLPVASEGSVLRRRPAALEPLRRSAVLAQPRPSALQPLKEVPIRILTHSGSPAASLALLYRTQDSSRAHLAARARSRRRQARVR